MVDGLVPDMNEGLIFSTKSRFPHQNLWLVGLPNHSVIH